MWIKIWNKTRTNRALLILTSPWIIGILGLIILLISGPVDFEPYRLAELSTVGTLDNISYWYDLDHDGNSEFLEFRVSDQNPASVYVFDRNNYFLDIVNLGGHWIKRPIFTIDDWDRDGSPELYSLVRRNDSLFVTQNSFLDMSDNQKRKFVTLLQSNRLDFTMTMHSMKLTDNNGDGHPELIFVLSAGYQRQPRAVFAWDLFHDSIYRSPLSGANIPYEFEFCDLNGDGVEEILGNSTATDNYNPEDTVPFKDDNSYLMVFTKDLDFLFDPLEITGRQTACQTMSVDFDGETFCLARTSNQRKSGAPPSIRLYSKSGEMIQYADDPVTDNRFQGKLIKLDQYPILVKYINDYSILSRLNERLEPVKSMTTEAGAIFFTGDLDGNGQDELIVMNRTGNYMEVFNAEFKLLCTAEIPTEFRPGKPVLSYRYIDGKLFSTGIQVPEYFLNLRFSPNTGYHWRILFYLASYFIVVLIVAGLYKIFEYRVRKQEEIRNRMMQLQLQTIMNQMNPHFTFNALNAVGAAIMKDEKNKAYDFLTQISEMIRGITKDAMVPYKTIGEELEFVRQYLSIQKFRYAGALTYHITVPQDIDLSVSVPKMLIHVFVENAFKHGVCADNKKGLIDIMVNDSTTNLVVSVHDNGPGLNVRKRSGQKQSGNGLNILREYLQLFKIQFNREITFTLDNLIDGDGIISGTIAEITIKK